MNQPIRVLLVEDNPADQDLIIESLEESRLPMAVTVARDGATAVDMLLGRQGHAEALRPDLILLDLNLPKMDGRDVLAIIKSHDDLHSIPLVILSGSDNERANLEGYTLGACCYLTKSMEVDAMKGILDIIERYWAWSAREG